MRLLHIEHKTTDFATRSFRTYLREVSHIKVLEPKEEADLCEAMRRGGKEGGVASEKLISANLRFVISVAKHYQGRGLDLEDLVNEGNIGLVRAAETFDATRGFKFISYAVWYIRQSIQGAVNAYKQAFMVPQNSSALSSHISKVSAAFYQTHHRMPTDGELSETLGEKPSTIKTVRQSIEPTLSLSTPLGPDSDTAMEQTLMDRESHRPDWTMDRESLHADLVSSMSNVLNDKERTVIMMSFGIGCTECGLEDIGFKLGLTRERVRQIKESAIKRLRRSNCIIVLKQYLAA